MLSFIFSFLIIVIFYLVVIDAQNVKLLQKVSFFSTLFLFWFILANWFVFSADPTFFFNTLACYNWFSFYSVCFALDALGFFFFLLTSLICFICVLGSFQSIKKNLKDYLILVVCIELLLFGVFSVLDFFVFYLFFEIILIPMFFIIGFWGSSSRRMKAAYYLFLYTLFGSLFLLLSLILLGLHYGSFSWFVMLTDPLTSTRELFLWPGIFLSFAIKIPMLPFHIWLPEAHVEAPTGGSIILASLLLKLGAYGFLRYLFPLFKFATAYYSSAVYIIALASVVYASLVALRQIDLKRIIAYSSIAHMNFGLLGLFSGTLDGLLGGFYIMLGHGLVSGALFYLIGVVYDRYKTRIAFYYGGLAFRMPIFAGFLFFFSAANIGFPGTVNFPAEVLILFGLSISNLFVCAVSGISFFLTAIYTFWLYNRIVFGTTRVGVLPWQYDLTRIEFFILGFFVLLTMLFGFFPNSVLVLVSPVFLSLIR